MPFNVNDFKTNALIDGGARPALFDVTFAFPAFVTSVSSLNTQAQFSCKAASIPASTIGVIEQGYFGRKLKLAGDRTFENWQIQIINDENFNIRDAFEQWHNGINTIGAANIRQQSALSEGNDTGGIIISASGAEGSASGTYKVDMQVQQYGKATNNTPIRQYNFVGVWPVEVGAITLDWDNQNQIEIFPVTLAYDYWEYPPLATNAPTSYS
jgi:hypothetical protein